MEDKKYYSVSDFSKEFLISRQTVYRLIYEGYIDFIKIRSLIRIPKREVIRYEKERERLEKL